MMDPDPGNGRLNKLIEREKELKCIYRVDNVLRQDQLELEEILKKLTIVIPPGWQYPDICRCRIHYESKTYQAIEFKSSGYVLVHEILVGDHIAGHIEVAYTGIPETGGQPVFLPEERQLLNTISTILGQAIFRRKLRSTIELLQSSRNSQTLEYEEEQVLNPSSDRHWRWRYDMVEKIADHLDPGRFGMKGLYLIGSTKNATAGPGSDIDLLAHTSGDPLLDEKLRIWMEGWGYCLGEINYQRTGYGETKNLIDLHIVTDEDIAKQDSYARMIGAVTDGARPIKLKSR